jgi:DNA-binding response OmpR family regulator
MTTHAQFTILVVDDDSMTRKVVVDMLRDEGLATEEAASYQAAWGAYARGKFDVIILDNQLEDGTGIELCRQIKETDGEVTIFLFAGASEEVRLEALECGVTEVLQKPYDLSKLAYLVKRAARRGKASDH